MVPGKRWKHNNIESPLSVLYLYNVFLEFENGNTQTVLELTHYAMISLDKQYRYMPP